MQLLSVWVSVSFSNNCLLVGCRIGSIIMQCECCKLHGMILCPFSPTLVSMGYQIGRFSMPL
jgi:hypothetical protein